MNKMNGSLVLLGWGGHARVILEIIHLLNLNLSKVSVGSGEDGEEIEGVQKCTDHELLENACPSQTPLLNGLGSLPFSTARQEIFRKFKSHKFQFVNLIHPAAIVARDVQLGEGCQLMASVTVQPGSKIGENSIINTSASLDHDCSIGAHCHIAPGAVLSGGVSVGKETHIGTGASIIQNIKIGENVIIGAGATVYEDVASGTKVINESKNRITRWQRH